MGESGILDRGSVASRKRFSGQVNTGISLYRYQEPVELISYSRAGSSISQSFDVGKAL